MRILHVNKFLYRRGGAEAYALDLGDLQRQRGHEVGYWGMQHPENPSWPLEHTFAPHVEYEPAPPGAAARVRLLANMVWSPAARRGLSAAIAAFRPDVAHLHNVYHQLSPSVLAALSDAGVPAVMTLHDYKLACPTYSMLDGEGQVCDACLGGRLRNAARKRCGGSAAAGAAAALEVRVHRMTGAYGHVGRFLCPSRFLAGVLERAGVYPERLHVLSNYVDATDFAPRVEGRGPVVFVGRLSFEKGVDVLIRAAALLPEGVQVEVAGAGPEDEALRRLAEEVAPGRVLFHGRLSRDQVLALLQRAGVVAVPSRWYENQPISVLEAFASAVPVVATRYGGLTEMVRPGESGELVPPDDPAPLARALTDVLSDPARNLAMGRAARRQAEQGHDPEDHLDALEEHYRSAGL